MCNFKWIAYAFTIEKGIHSLFYFYVGETHLAINNGLMFILFSLMIWKVNKSMKEGQKKCDV